MIGYISIVTIDIYTFDANFILKKDGVFYATTPTINF